MRRLATWAPWALALSLLAGCATRDPVEPQPPPAAATARAALPPNIVLIVSDDHGWSDYGFMGNADVRTPNLDRLASEGFAFSRGYVPSSLCAPSLASLVTGLYPHQHGITSNEPPGDEEDENERYRAGRRRMAELLARARPLPERLAELDYLSLQTGKWWQGHFSNGGFTHGMSLDREGDRRHGGDGLEIGRESLEPIFDFVAGARREEKPFFVWYAPMLPHTPHDPPRRLRARHRGEESAGLARYRAMVEWLDETVGELLAYLDREGLAQHTIVVYLADNGWLQDPVEAERSVHGRAKNSPYDAGLRTPILLRWPGRIPPQRSEAPALSIDLVPTLLHAAGLPPDPRLPGIDLLDEHALGARPRIFGECFSHDAVDLDAPGRSLRWRWVIEERWKLIVPSALNEPDRSVELFDVVADPHERNDSSGAEPGRVAELSDTLDAWWPGTP